MRKIFYIILSLCLCTAGIGTAAHLSPAALLTDSLSAPNDTVPDEEKDIDNDDEEDEDEDEEEYVDDEEDDEDDEEYADEDEDDEDDEEYDEEEDDEDDEEYDEEEDEDDDDEDGEYDDEEDDEDDDDSLFTQEEEDEFGEMHDDYADDAELDSDIELTEGMRVSAEEMMDNYSAQNYLSPDTTKYQFKEADANLYIERLRRMPVVMEMPYNDVVRKYIDQYTRMQRSVSVMLGAQNFYNPIFEEALEAEGCPLELKYLPVIESAYNPSATSPVGAAGLWQFMPATGKQYGLEINSLVDERRDPVKSSHAAARLLKYLYKYYGDWSLVIAAYNCGPGNVNKAIQRAGGTKDYWAIYNYLPKETRGYVPAFIAANYVMNYYCEHGITPMKAKLPAETDTIVVNRDVHFKQIADLCGVDINQIKDLNPHYRTQVVPGYWKPCIVRLPTEAVSKFVALGDSVYTYKAGELLPRRSVATIGTSNGSTARSYAQGRSNVTTARTNNGYAKPANNGYSKPANNGYTKPRTYYKPKTYVKPNTYVKPQNNGYAKKPKVQQPEPAKVKKPKVQQPEKAAPVKKERHHAQPAPVKKDERTTRHRTAPAKQAPARTTRHRTAPAKQAPARTTHHRTAPAKKAPARTTHHRAAPAKKSSHHRR